MDNSVIQVGYLNTRRVRWPARWSWFRIIVNKKYKTLKQVRVTREGYPRGLAGLAVGSVEAKMHGNRKIAQPRVFTASLKSFPGYAGNAVALNRNSCLKSALGLSSNCCSGGGERCRRKILSTWFFGSFLVPPATDGSRKKNRRIGLSSHQFFSILDLTCMAMKNPFTFFGFS